MTKHLETLIDDVVKSIDYDIWKESYNEKTSESPKDVEDSRDELRDILEEYVDAFDLLEILYKAGLEDWDEYENALKALGRPIYRE